MIYLPINWGPDCLNQLGFIFGIVFSQNPQLMDIGISIGIFSGDFVVFELRWLGFDGIWSSREGSKPYFVIKLWRMDLKKTISCVFVCLSFFIIWCLPATLRYLWRRNRGDPENWRRRTEKSTSKRQDSVFYCLFIKFSYYVVTENKCSINIWCYCMDLWLLNWLLIYSHQFWILGLMTWINWNLSCRYTF